MTADGKRLSTRLLLCWSAVSFVSLLSAFGIAMRYRQMAPVREGNSHMFWNIATGVSLSPTVEGGWGGDAYFVDDVWAAYDASHMHGSDIYRVSLSDVTADFDEVVALLERAVQGGEDTPVLKGYVNWRNDKDKPRSGSALLDDVKRARDRKLIEEDVDLFAYRLAGEQQFWQRWQRADWYWANFVFEWTMLTGLAVFGLWPAIRNQSALRYAIHVSFLPILFLLPTYLGYATFSFTSAGPSGGILYPILLMFCRGGSVTAVDSVLLRRIPQILEPLSTPIGSPMTLSGIGMPGPTYAILAGVVAGVIVFAVISSFRSWSEHRRSAALTDKSVNTLSYIYGGSRYSDIEKSDNNAGCVWRSHFNR